MDYFLAPIVIPGTPRFLFVASHDMRLLRRCTPDMITARSLVSASVRDRGIFVWALIDHWPSVPMHPGINLIRWVEMSIHDEFWLRKRCKNFGSPQTEGRPERRVTSWTESPTEWRVTKSSRPKRERSIP